MREATAKHSSGKLLLARAVLGSLLVALPLLAMSLALAQSTDDHASERVYITQAESDWAESVVTNDVSVLERILANDLVGVDIDGSHYSKADAIKDFR